MPNLEGGGGARRWDRMPFLMPATKAWGSLNGARVRPTRRAREKTGSTGTSDGGGTAIDFLSFALNRSCLAAPERNDSSSPGNELPGATLPWALTKILHTREKIGNTGRRPDRAAPRGVRPGLAGVC